jgi:predicted phosphodiesterase
MTSRRNFVKQAGAGILAMGATPALYGFAAPEQAIGLQPYLQNPAPDGMTVMWHTADPSYSYVEYGTSETGSMNIARATEHGIVAANITRHKVRITGLTPNTKYYYRICSQKVLTYGAYSKTLGPVERSAFHSFTTLSLTPKDFTCLIFTDLHNNLTLYDKLMDKVASYNIDFDFSIFNGDIFEDPASDAQALNLIARYNQRVGAADKPVIYLRGNHEIRGSYAMQLQAFFDTPEGDTYYAFSWGDTRFVLLDNGEDKNDGHPEYSGLVDFDGFRNRQTEWLVKELAGSDFNSAFRKILVHHIPIYSWTNSYDPGFIPCFNLWNPIFGSTPFDIDITGHLHSFSYYPKNEVNNPFPLVVGGGNTESNGRVMILTKRGEALTLKSLACTGIIEVFPIYCEEATLTNVLLTGGKLSPDFDPQQTSYRILVPSETCTLSLTGLPSSETSTVRGNIIHKPCTVNETIRLTVIEGDGTEKVYSFTVEQEQETTGIDSRETSPANIKIYPNPIDENSILHAEMDRHYDNITVKILNEAGATIQTTRAQGQYLAIPLALQQGVYILTLHDGKKQTAHKIVVK